MRTATDAKFEQLGRTGLGTRPKSTFLARFMCLNDVVLEHEAHVAPLWWQVGRFVPLDGTVSSSASWPATMRSRVDLAPPEGPSSAVSSPRGSSEILSPARRSRRTSR